ncbi:MAG TPA: DUF87 domain-containing protein [Alphaproteobacteria bacterium]|nr:DUF87 domain-containing protein [Alphaproteobacteria bacterium]
MKKFLDDAAFQRNPLRILQDFVEKEEKKESAKDYDNWRFVGYVLDIGYNTTTIITSDPFKQAVGGIPRNSLLIMVPSNFGDFPPHFTLLRVLETAPTPLTKEVQQTYFELQKKSMPELDVFTQSELQWGALKTSVLGMYYPHPEHDDKLEFSGDLNSFVSAHKYRVYAPDDALLDLIVNSLVPPTNQFNIGKLRLTESRLPLPDTSLPDVDVSVSTLDFMGTRTAMFGKTRLGKSNVIKIIAQSLIETSRICEEDERTHNVGQIIFDINGEYANDNPQDEDCSIRGAYPDDCTVYAITPKENTPSQPLRLDFYAHPHLSHHLIKTFIRDEDRHPPDYVSSFLSVEIPSFENLEEQERRDQIRGRRKILIFWAILHSAGYTPNIATLRDLGGFDPRFAERTRRAVYGDGASLPAINSLDSLLDELRRFTTADRAGPRLQSTSGNHNLFDSDDEALLRFLFPTSTTASGPRKLQKYRIYHDSHATNFVQEILEGLRIGQTVILDLSNAHPEVMQYFSQWLTEEIFSHQVELFSNNDLRDHYIQLYFEEAHNLFPADEAKITDIYSRIAKEGAKYHIGMVYSTQSPSTISGDLLAQTENFFVAHISARNEVKKLANLNVEFENLQEDILHSKTPGYLRMLTRAHRFVVPVQARRFSPTTPQPEGS